MNLIESRTKRTVTTVVAVESVVEGNADHNTVAQNVMAALNIPTGVVMGDIGDRTAAYPRAIGLIESSEREVNADEWGG